MDGSIRLSGSERKTALSIYRGGGDARVARRAHVLLLLDRNWSYRQIMESLLCARDFVLFQCGGVGDTLLFGGLHFLFIVTA